MSNEKRRGLMLVLSSPSGAGKTTLSRMLLKKDPEIIMSVSATTRPMRPGEQEGVDYNFISHEKFAAMQQAGEFLEYATVFGHKYGTPKQPVLAALDDGFDVLFDIDWQGTQQLSSAMPAGSLVKVFLLPPSLDELERRLRSRAQDSEDVIARRMQKAPDEISHWVEYDYVLVNDDLNKCFDELYGIVRVERLKLQRQPAIAAKAKEYYEYLKRLAEDLK